MQLHAIMAGCKSSFAPLKKQRHIDDDNPTIIQATIAYTAPSHTEDIVTNKHSTFLT